MPNPLLFAKILVVDDEVEVCNTLKEFLEGEQCHVDVAHDGEEALAKISDFQPYCVLLDIRMPYLNGMEALKMIKDRAPDVEIIMVTAVASIKIAEECLRSGAFGYVTKPVDLDHLLKEIQSALEHRQKILADKKKLGLEKQEKKELEEMNKLLNKELFEALQFPILILGFVQQEFSVHSRNVAWLSQKIAEQLNLPHNRLCSLAGLYHDLGKLCLPPSIKNREPKTWTPAEKKIYENYPIYGQDLLQSHFHLKSLGSVIRYHCENVDGSGFPDRLKGEDIPLESKIVALANAVDEELIQVQKRNIETDMEMATKLLRPIERNLDIKYDRGIYEALIKFLKNYKAPPPDEEVGIFGLQRKMILSRDIVTQSGKLIFPKNFLLTEHRIDKIMDLNQVDPLRDPVRVFPEKKT